MNQRAAAPIKTVLFDLSEVLLTGLIGTAEQLSSVLQLPPELIDRQLKPQAWHDVQLGRLFESEYWEAVRRTSNWNVPIDLLQQAVRQNFREIEGVRPQIVDLRRRGYRLGLVSNHVREWVDFLEPRFAFHQLFDDHVFSYQLGMAKPDRDVYAVALRRLGADPETTLVVDDSVKNLLSARELGCQVLQFLTPHQFAADLQVRVV